MERRAFAASPSMARSEFIAIRDYILRRSGIYFAETDKDRLARRLESRLAATKCHSFTEYYLYLQRHHDTLDEFEEIIELVTTHETYFFRERRQLTAFSTEVLPELQRRSAGQRTLRIWSAGCATGEEVYTLAMLALEHGLHDRAQIEIFGSDISRKVIARARNAVYGRNSFRDMESSYLKRYFVESQGGYAVNDEVKRLTSFGTINLLDPVSLAIVAPADVIFCRNVIIYFHQEARRKLIDMFFRKLRPGGYLLLGHAESLLNVSTQFEIVNLRHDLVYRRPERS